MIEAMIDILRTGCPWRDLPTHFGPWSSVYTRWSRWSGNGFWAAILDLLAEGEKGQLRHLDSTHIKVHQCQFAGKITHLFAAENHPPLR